MNRNEFKQMQQRGCNPAQVISDIDGHVLKNARFDQTDISGHGHRDSRPNCIPLRIRGPVSGTPEHLYVVQGMEKSTISDISGHNGIPLNTGKMNRLSYDNRPKLNVNVYEGATVRNKESTKVFRARWMTRNVGPSSLEWRQMHTFKILCKRKCKRKCKYAGHLGKYKRASPYLLSPPFHPKYYVGANLAGKDGYVWKAIQKQDINGATYFYWKRQRS